MCPPTFPFHGAETGSQSNHPVIRKLPCSSVMRSGCTGPNTVGADSGREAHRAGYRNRKLSLRRGVEK